MLTACERPLEPVSSTDPTYPRVKRITGKLADGRALLGETAPGPAAVRRDCGRLTGPLLGGVFAEHGLDDLGDELHDASLTRAALEAPGGVRIVLLG